MYLYEPIQIPQFLVVSSFSPLTLDISQNIATSVVENTQVA